MSAPGQGSFQYLPMQVGERVLGIPLAAITRVWRLSEVRIEPGSASDGGSSSGEMGMAVIDLPRLLTGKPYIADRAHAVAVEAGHRSAALIVDGVYPVRVAAREDHFGLPPTFPGPRHLFEHVIRDGDALILIIALGSLLDGLDRAAGSPREAGHVA